jgi:hypothetical protein
MGSVGKLDRMLRKSVTMVHYVTERQMIQMLDCARENGALHIPLAPARVASMEE